MKRVVQWDGTRIPVQRVRRMRRCLENEYSMAKMTRRTAGHYHGQI